MAKLIYILGTMGSAKTANAIMMWYDYVRHNKKVLFLKSSLDTRDGKNIIKSRIEGLSAPVSEYDPEDNLTLLFNDELKYVDRIIMDECEFATKSQIDQLKIITTYHNIPVTAYGLRTDFLTTAFDGSIRLFELADDIKMFENICPCGELAIVNARFNSKTGEILYEGPRILIGGDSDYIGLCYKCWQDGHVKVKK